MQMKNEYSIIREIKRLKSIRGSGTELVSVYIPAGYQISEEVARLRNEYSTSSNIKSKQTRTSVLGAIDKILQYLKLYRETPKNGIAIFCGNVSDNQAKTDIELFSIEPPFPLKINLYRCDNKFLLDPIEDIVEARDMYALLVMDGREATVATLKGHHIQIIKRMNSMAHAKVRKGGQSAARYERGIEESINEFHSRIGECINALFAANDFKIKGLVVGGPGPAKEGFNKSNVLNYQIKTLGTYDTGYTDDYGLQELMEKAEALFKEQEAAQERRVIERFMQEISRGGLATYGYENTKKALEAGQVNKLILNKDLDIFRVKYKCNSCGALIEKFEIGDHREAKHDCGGTLQVTGVEDAIESLVDIADKKGVEMTFVSNESSYGKEFLMGFRGIGAILKYKS